jgi:hypothetical protein
MPCRNSITRVLMRGIRQAFGPGSLIAARESVVLPPDYK